MISFFKKIRRKLVADNKIQTYLKYAFGEIFLVMIGILLALQVNNWNEGRKLKDQEIKALKELRSDLEQNFEDITQDKKLFEVSLRSNEIILKQMENSLPYNDSLDTHFAKLLPWSSFSINSTTFDNIRQAGSNLISNDSLRKSVTSFYTSYMNLYKELESRELIEHNTKYVKPMLMTAFSEYDFNSMKPRNYDAFIKNQDYNQILHYNVTLCKGMTEYQKSLLKVIKRLIDQINTEIDRLE